MIEVYVIRHVKILLFACLTTVVFASIGAARGEDAADSDRRGAVVDARIARAFETEAKPRTAKDANSAGSSGGGSTAFLTIVVGVLALGAIGVLGRSARDRGRSRAGGVLAVVDRVAISPKHAVFLVKAGDRTLILGTGPQGPPALLGELESTDAVSEAEPIESANKFSSFVESAVRLTRGGSLRADEKHLEFSRSAAAMNAVIAASDSEVSPTSRDRLMQAGATIASPRIEREAEQRAQGDAAGAESFNRPPATTVRIGGVL
jgi:flagellar biogenesis protein FliO